MPKIKKICIFNAKNKTICIPNAKIEISMVKDEIINVDGLNFRSFLLPNSGTSHLAFF